MSQENQTQELVVSTGNYNQAPSIYSTPQSFEDAQRVCKMLCASTLVPKEYQGNISNTMIAYEVSVRTGMSPFMVMQNLDIIQGRPSWSSKYVIAALNACGRFSPIQFEYQDLGAKTVEYTEVVWSEVQGRKQKNSVKKSINIQDRSCVAYARNVYGDIVKGPAVSMEMAVREGWYTKDGSKWVTMPELMLSYRSAKFFGNLYAPDVLMGMSSVDEVNDMPTNGTKETPSTVSILNEKFNDSAINDAAVVEEEEEEII